MDWVYKKVMTWILGEALANSDRVKVAVAAAVAKGLLTVLAGCAVCQAVLNPATVDALSNWIAGTALSLIVSISHRDVAKPGEVVAGAATPHEYVDTRALRGDRP